MNDHKELFDAFVATHLNGPQRDAVMQASGPLLVVAGAGSGKTRVITARMAHLILNENIDPSALVALTFTNKAAQEMQARVVQFLAPNVPRPFVGTFHAYCLRFLKAHQELLNIPFFSILDDDDRQKILSGIIKRNNLAKRLSTRQLSHAISLIKNQSIEPERSQACRNDRIMLEVYQAYESEKRASKCFDFDDLLLETVKILTHHKDARARLHETVRHVMVDEYQDTNIVQHALLKLMVQNERKLLAITSLCVVGDEDQSIYSWRGATVSNILNFKNDFPHTTIVKIEQNYRCVQPVLEVANEIIAHNKNRIRKNLWSTRPGSDRVVLLACSSEYQEADAVASFLKTTVQQSFGRATMAVLYRAHYQSRALEEALIKRGIPYTIVGGIQFYERKEIKDLLAYLRLTVNPFDRTSFFRIINCPQRGLGQAFEDSFYECWRDHPTSDFVDVAKELEKNDQLTTKKQQTLQSFVELFRNLNPSDKPTTVLETIIEKTRYLTYLKDEFDRQEAESKVDNISELVQAMRHLENNGVATVGAFLDEVSLLQEKIVAARRDDTNAAVLMTLHAAKGLEFDHIAIAGLNEDLLPSSRSVTEHDALEEERRLLYVGITRARERLMLSYARCRHVYGNMAEHLPSRFINEIPPALFTRHDIGHASIAHLDNLFAQWLSNSKDQRRGPILTFGAAGRRQQA